MMVVLGLCLSMCTGFGLSSRLFGGLLLLGTMYGYVREREHFYVKRWMDGWVDGLWGWRFGLEE